MPGSVTGLDVQGLWRLLVQLGQAAVFLGEARDTAVIIGGASTRSASVRLLYDGTRALMEEAGAQLDEMGRSPEATLEAQAFVESIRDTLRPEWVNSRETVPPDDRGSG